MVNKVVILVFVPAFLTLAVSSYAADLPKEVGASPKKACSSRLALVVVAGAGLTYAAVNELRNRELNQEMHSLLSKDPRLSQPASQSSLRIDPNLVANLHRIKALYLSQRAKVFGRIWIAEDVLALREMLTLSQALADELEQNIFQDVFPSSAERSSLYELVLSSKVILQIDAAEIQKIETALTSLEPSYRALQIQTAADSLMKKRIKLSTDLADFEKALPLLSPEKRSIVETTIQRMREEITRIDEQLLNLSAPRR